MKVKIRADSVEIEGYVNAIERNSKPLMSRIGHFIERICKGAFAKAIKRNDDIHILLNHDWQRDLGSTKKGNLELQEDTIGLKARATITDPEVVEDARKGNLVGWSFGFSDRDVENSVERGMPLREVRDLDLYEVSLLNKAMKPAYDGTLVSARSEDGEKEIHFRGEDFIDDVKVEEEGGVEEKEEDAKEEEAEKVDITSQDVNEDSENNERAESQETEKSVDNSVDNAVEKLDKIDYSIYRNMINEMKEEK